VKKRTAKRRVLLPGITHLDYPEIRSSFLNSILGFIISAPSYTTIDPRTVDYPIIFDYVNGFPFEIVMDCFYALFTTPLFRNPSSFDVSCSSTFYSSY